jgi:hypothetical protein
VVVVIGLVLLASPRADAHFAASLYTYSASDCRASSFVDPINAIFWGGAAGVSNAAEQIEDHTLFSYGLEDGWIVNPAGGPQYFRDHGNCTSMDTDRADANVGPYSRFHIRLEGLSNHGGPGRMTIGDAHHEDYIAPFQGCGVLGGHAVDKGTKENPTPQGSGFDQGRRRLVKAFRKYGRHHEVSVVSAGNTDPRKQCDGDWAGSDGKVAFFNVGHQSQ